MAYNGRRAPNLAQYVRDIENLNEIPSDQDLQGPGFEYDMDQDLALFTNTQFFDFEMGADNGLPVTDDFNVDTIGETVAPGSIDMKSLEFQQGKPALDFTMSALYGGSLTLLLLFICIVHALSSSSSTCRRRRSFIPKPPLQR
jgi:hypothetical protein